MEGKISWKWPCCCGCLAVMMFILVFVMAGVSIGLQNARGDLGASFFVRAHSLHAGETFLLPSSISTFCEELDLRNDRVSASTLYLLTEEPELSVSNNFTAREYNEYQLSPKQYEYFDSNFHPGSTLSMNYCIQTADRPINFYVIKGGSVLQLWLANPDSRHSMKNVTIANSCVNGFQNFHYTFTGTTDFYGLAFYNPGTTPGQFTAHLQFNRIEYGTPDGIIADSCSVGTGPGQSHFCRIPVPLGIGSRAMIAVGIENQGSSSLYWKCTARQWVYGIILCIPLFLAVVIASTAGIMLACQCIRRSRDITPETLSAPSAGELAHFYPSEAILN